MTTLEELQELRNEYDRLKAWNQTLTATLLSRDRKAWNKAIDASAVVVRTAYALGNPSRDGLVASILSLKER